ncbi:hypothetical protein [Paraburkholderia adhaesiva]|uniref:hypothetical protein n=1 Tax=Paraburkholderia adhaesiva TaxID=2883244 RepID=UPI001F45352C|nr:hypothetical protein [Paraburkholderia adhaesiva]
MNARHREQRIREAEDARAAALYNLARAHQALDTIRATAETHAHSHDRAEALRIIAITARGALLDALRPDPGFVPGADHERETP